MRDDHSGYLSSNRVGGRGSDDIYAFKALKPKQYVLKVIMVNKADNSRIAGGDVTLVNIEKHTNWAEKTNPAGTTGFMLEKNMAYALKGEYKDLSGDSTSLATTSPTQSDTIIKYLYLSPAPKPEVTYKVGDVFVLEDLYYDFDKYNIRPDAAKILDKLVETLQTHPNLEIELSSHTDSRGNDAYNMKLSQHRAESAVAYLESRGITAKRLQAKGYGETRLLNKCKNGVPCTDAEHQLNRRTEVRVLKN